MVNNDDKISHVDMESIFAEIPKTESYIRKKLERAFVHFQKRILANLSLTAKLTIELTIKLAIQLIIELTRSR